MGAVAIYLCLMSALLGGVALAGRRFGAELRRKLFHIGVGVLTTSWPFVFTELWPVLILETLGLGTLLIIRARAGKRGLGSVLYQVERESLGEVYFAVASVILFAISGDRPVFFIVPIAILTFADSVAALIGVNYGRRNLGVAQEGSKSIEGSVTFFVVAFLCTIVALLLFSDVGRAETLLIALILGVLAALVEMVSYGGNDNLFIPLSAYAFLSGHVAMTTLELLWRLALLFGVYLLAWALKRFSNLSKLAVMESVVGAYLIFALYGLPALFAPIMLYATYAVLPRLTEREKLNVMNLHIVETNLLVGLALAWLAQVLHQERHLFVPYVLAFALHLSCNTYTRLKFYFALSEGQRLLGAIAKGAGFILLPGLLMIHALYATEDALRMGEIAGACMLLIVGTFAMACIKRYEVVDAQSKGSGLVNAAIVAVCVIVQIALTNFLQVISGLKV